jgi:hypothetical protein
MRSLAIIFAAVLTLSAQDTPAHRAQIKLDRISNSEYKPGQVVDFPPVEINAWAALKVPEAVPDGIRNPHIELGAGEITATALVDFLKMRQSHGQTTNRLMAAMLEGERPLKITVRISSSASRCTVYLTRVELGGAVLEGAVLDFLIQNFFKPLYPDAKINEPFDLDYNIDRLEAHPTALRVILK